MTFGRNLRITDRSIDRSVRVWSNNIDSNHAVEIASTNGSVYFAWQDSRNSNPEAQPEDVFRGASVCRRAAPYRRVQEVHGTLSES